jgi:two-component system LytT family sensor kinase
MISLRMPRNTTAVIFTHLLGWLLFQSLPIVFLAMGMGLDTHGHWYDILMAWQYWQFVFIYIVIFYFHQYVLRRWNLYQHKAWYVLFLGVMLALILWLRPFDVLISSQMHFRIPPEMMKLARRFPKMPERRGPRVDITSIIFMIMLIAMGLLLHISQRWRDTQAKMIRVEADKAQAELAFLKAQIHPHFLFNTLNNIYALAVTKNENTADSIMKLSNIMRYVTDGIQEDRVSLQQELDCISDYIDLQQLRLGKKVKLDFTVTGDPEHKHIAPLLLMTFIENVFKYGISSHEAAELIIHIKVDDKGIYLHTENALFPATRPAERTGIGIGNTRKRLLHLYPEKHTLTLTRKENRFIVDLELRFN